MSAVLLEKLFTERLSQHTPNHHAEGLLKQYGLPSQRDERWKYTSLKGLERTSFLIGEKQVSSETGNNHLIEAATRLVGNLPSAGIVVFSGHDYILSDNISWLSISNDQTAISADLLNADPLVTESGSDGFIWLNLARHHQVLHLDLPADIRVDAPLHIIYLQSDTTSIQHIRQHWQLAAGTRLDIVEHFVEAEDKAGDKQQNALSTVYRTIDLSDKAELHWVQYQHTGTTHTAIQHTHIQQSAESICRQVQLDIGARLLRHEVRVQLNGEQAHYHYAGLLLGHGRQHRDQQVYVEHRAKNCSSEQHYRSVLAGHARGVVNTAATVAASADGSEIQQHTASLLLSDNAEMDAKPQLEINADEVIASHGATIGQLDDEAVFYLQSRGIPEPQARRLLIAGFARHIVELISATQLSDHFNAKVDEHLEQLL